MLGKLGKFSRTADCAQDSKPGSEFCGQGAMCRLTGIWPSHILAEYRGKSANYSPLNGCHWSSQRQLAGCTSLDKQYSMST